jgi:diketogulonate reductase-like aldo/keto reductase
MHKLRLDVLDLYLIHWPLPMFDEYVETWKTFGELRASGRVRSIGVSNFTEKHLRRLLDETGMVPVVNQVELSPQFPQRQLRAFHAEHGILTEAWGPLGQGRGLLEEPVVSRLAKEKGKSGAQIVLRWHIELGNVIIPKSLHPERLLENVNIFDFELEADEMKELATLQGNRFGPDPEAFDKRF